MGLDTAVGQLVMHFRVHWVEVLEVVESNG